MRRRMSRKKMISILVLFSTLIVLLALLFAPSFIEGMEKNRLKDEITNISERLNNENINLEEIDTYLNKKITSGKRKKVEVSVEKYLKEAVKNSNQILTITKEKELLNALNTKTIETNTYDFTKTKEVLAQHKENVKPCKEALEKLPIEKDDYIKANTNSKELIDLYKELLAKDLNIKKYIELTDNTTTKIDTILEAINYLENNRDNWKIEENNLIFTKRNKLSEYE